MSDPKVIYLGPECEDEFCDGRTWADHVAWPDCDCNHKPVRYNLGSDYDAALAQEAALREERYRFKRLRSSFLNRVLCERDALQQRLTDAEKRVDRYMALLECVIDTGELTPEKHEQLESDICDEVKKFWERAAALKPVEGEGS